MTALLEVKDLRVNFMTASGIARAVDGIDFSIAPSRTTNARPSNDFETRSTSNTI